MISKPQFSFVIPVYNVAPYLRECLDSVLAQAFENWEAVCVDDGSTDGSGAILDKYALKDPRIVVVHQANQGVCRARNAGMQIARGNWLIFLDSDDVLHSRALEILAEIIDENPDVDAVRYGRQDFDNKWNIPNVEVGSVTIHENSERIAESDFFIHCWRFCYKTDAIGGLCYDEEIKYNMGEDCVFLAEALERLSRIAVVDAQLIGYRQRVGSAMHTRMTVKKKRYYFMHMRKLCEIVERDPTRYDYMIRRRLGMRLVDGLSKYHLSSFDGNEKAEVFCQWLETIRSIRHYRFLTRWCKFAVEICCIFPCRSIAWVICDLPYLCKVLVYRKLGFPFLRKRRT